MKVEPSNNRVLLLLSLFIISGYVLNAQIVNDGATLTIESGLTIYATDHFENKATGTVDNQGTLELKNDWTNTGTPGVSNKVRFSGTTNQNISGTTSFEDVDIDNTASVTIASGTQEISGILTLEGGVLNTNNNLVIKSTLNSTGMIDDFTPASPGSINGDIIMQRYIFGNGFRFHQIGSAVDNPPLTELSELNLYGPDGAQIISLPSCDPYSIDPNSPYGNLFEMHEDGPFPNNCDQEVWYVRSAGNMENARGYSAITNGTVTLDIQGAPNTGTVTYANLQNTNAIGDGFQLVSNPYPSPIIWTAPPGFDGQAHILRSFGLFAGTFQPILSTQGVSITSSQGFQVRVSGAPADFVLTNSDRTRTDAPFYKQPAWYKDLLVLELEGNGFADKTTIYFDNNPTTGWDSQYDAHKLKSNNGQPTLYTQIDNYPENIGINGLPMINYPTSIPMGLMPGTSGSYEITAKELETFETTGLVYLEDLKEQTLKLLNENPIYSFTANVSDNYERFVLHFIPPAEINTTDGNCTDVLGAIDINLGNHQLNGNTIIWDDYSLKDDNGNVVANGTHANGLISVANLEPGNYTLTLNMGGYQAIELIEVEGVSPVQSTFTPNITIALIGETIQFTNQSTGATNYDWDFGDGSTSTNIADPAHSYANEGIYEVTLSAYNDDCIDGSSHNIEVKKLETGIDDPDTGNGFYVYREADLMLVKFDFEITEQGTLSIYNLLGKELYRSDVRTTGVHRINSFTYPDGYYIVRLITDNESFNRKELLIRGK